MRSRVDRDRVRGHHPAADSSRVILSRLGVRAACCRARRLLGLEETEIACARDGPGAGGRAELAEDGTRVRLHSVVRDVKLSGDLALREFASEESQDGELALGQVPEG